MKQPTSVCASVSSQTKAPSIPQAPRKNRTLLGRASRWAVAASAVTALAVTAAPEASADVCIGDGAKKALQECPGGKLQQGSGKAPQVSFKTAPAEVKLKKR